MSRPPELISPGPHGEAPNVRARAAFDLKGKLWEDAAWRLVFIPPAARWTLAWVPDEAMTLTGFYLEGPPEIVVRQVYVGLEPLLESATTLREFAPVVSRGALGFGKVRRTIVRPWEYARLEFGA